MSDPILREINGKEMHHLLTEWLVDEFRAAVERILTNTDRFGRHLSYPVATVRGELVIKVLPDSSDPAPFTIPLDFPIGLTLDTAPDALREAYSLPVMQPERQRDGQMVDTVVERPPRPRRAPVAKGATNA